MHTMVCSSGARYTPRTGISRGDEHEAARPVRERPEARSGLTLQRALAVLVTAATLSGACGDGASPQGNAALTPQPGPAALLAGTAGFKCHPWNRHSGACGNFGGAGGGGSNSGTVTGGVAGTAGIAGSGAGGDGAVGGQAPTGPFPILSPAAGPVAVTTDGASVVWVEPGAIRTCPVTGCGATAPAPLNASPFDEPVVDAVGIDQTYVYWLSSELVQRCARTGCQQNEAFAELPPGAVGTWRGLAVHGGVVYTNARTAVYQCPVTGCDQTPATVFGSLDDFGGTPFTVDDTGLFISLTGEAYGTYYCPFGACSPTLGQPLSTPGGARLAATNGTVYMWDTLANITSCPRTGCPGGATTLAAGQTKLTSIAADGSGVYWTTSDGTTGGVFKCALPACAGGPISLAIDQPNPVSVSVAEHVLVWANAGSAAAPGSIMALAK